MPALMKMQTIGKSTEITLTLPAPKAGLISLAIGAMLKAAAELGVKITWGGTWKTLVDMPHYQIELK